MGSHPGWGTRIPRAEWCGQKVEKNYEGVEVPVVPTVILMEQQSPWSRGWACFHFGWGNQGPGLGRDRGDLPGTYPKDREAQAGASSLAVALPPTGWQLVPNYLEKNYRTLEFSTSDQRLFYFPIMLSILIIFWSNLHGPNPQNVFCQLARFYWAIHHDGDIAAN